MAPLDCEHDNNAVQQEDEEEGNGKTSTIISTIAKVINILFQSSDVSQLVLLATKDYMQCPVQPTVPPELVQRNIYNNGSGR